MTRAWQAALRARGRQAARAAQDTYAQRTRCRGRAGEPRLPVPPHARQVNTAHRRTRRPSAGTGSRGGRGDGRATGQRGLPRGLGNQRDDNMRPHSLVRPATLRNARRPRDRRVPKPAARAESPGELSQSGPTAQGAPGGGCGGDRLGSTGHLFPALTTPNPGSRVPRHRPGPTRSLHNRNRGRGGSPGAVSERPAAPPCGLSFLHTPGSQGWACPAYRAPRSLAHLLPEHRPTGL